MTGKFHRLIQPRSGGGVETREIIDPNETAIPPDQDGTLIGYECRSGDFAT
jgi:hypothetical protein